LRHRSRGIALGPAIAGAFALSGPLAMSAVLPGAEPSPPAPLATPLAREASPPAPEALASPLELPGVSIRLRVPAGQMSGDPVRVRAWIERSARIVSAFYGSFPVRQLTLVVHIGDGERIGGGTTFGEPAPLIRVGIGRAVSREALQSDWVLVHEMIHLALPDVGEEHAWLSEGLATYVEGIARAQAHDRTPEDVFAEDVRSMPRGLPQPGDQGLDHTHTWGRTYWGGALFCLLADLQIRRETQQRRGLQDALRAILQASGGLTASWPIERVLSVGDAPTGTHVLEQLYAQMRDRPVLTDLPALWRELGVVPVGDGVRLIDSAPLAATREAILRPRSASAR